MSPSNLEFTTHQDELVSAMGGQFCRLAEWHTTRRTEWGFPVEYMHMWAERYYRCMADMKRYNLYNRWLAAVVVGSRHPRHSWSCCVGHACSFVGHRID